MNHLRLLCLSLILAAPAAQATTAELDLNDDAVRVDVRWESSSNSLEFGGGLLHHKDNGTLTYGSVHLVDIASGGDSDALQAGLGGKFVLLQEDRIDEDGQAAAIGGFFRYTFPNYNRLGIAGSLYFAPSILSFGDLDRYVEADVRVQYNVLRKADIYLGVRNVNVDFGALGEGSVETGVHLGVHLEF